MPHRFRLFLPILSFLAVVGPASADAVICLEAESAEAVDAPMVVIDAGAPAEGAMTPVAADASGGAYLEVAQGQGNPPKVTTGQARLRFTVSEAGTYMLWCRVWWLDECGNSFSVQIDDTRPFTFGQDATYKTWHWVKSPSRLRQLKLDAGEHTMVLGNREDGMRIDQVLLTTDRRLVPVDIERVTQP